ncbi:PAS domain-containing protein [Spirosoma fluviale]|uniref:histidine kinase n=1 Tax=Spirosoma fluviale TaxID=1597977 RepID=A0A286GSW9_9BACT|nr:PAS domain-containing protein [Spirosoma fluviale]SOD98667.1 PAS domain-containing protein [Spirosoma fluviale]
MLSDLPTQLSFAQLFDTSPDPVFWMRAVRAPDKTTGNLVAGSQNVPVGQIVDFVVEYVNPKVGELFTAENQLTIGLSVRYGSVGNADFTDYTFHQLYDVVETGTAMELEYFNPLLKQWLCVTRSRAGDGVLGIARVVTTPKEIVLETERQRLLLDSILNTSLSTVFVYEAIRDQNNEILDFGLLMVNKQGRAEALAYTGIDVVDKTLLTINPDSRRSGQFNLFKQVIESGEPIQVEQYYPFAQAWYNTSITRLNDGVVVMGNNITKQKVATLETEHQRALLDEILNASQEAMLVLEAIRDASGLITDFRFTHANSAATPLLGHAVETLRQRAFLDLFPGIQQAGLFAIYQTVVETGEPYRGEHFYNQDGLDNWFDVTAVKHGDGLLLTVASLTKARLAEQAIVESAANLQAVIDVAQTGIFVISPVLNPEGNLIDFRFKTINRVVAALVEQTPDVLTGSIVSDWFKNYRQTGLFDRYRHTLETGEKKRFELNYTVDNLNVWFDVKVIKFGQDLLVTFTDYTSLKQTQQILEQTAMNAGRQAALLNSVLDSSNSGVMAFEAIRDEAHTVVDFRFLVANQSSTKMVSRGQEEMVGNTLLTIFPGNVESGLFDLYKRTTETGEPGYTEIYYNHDGLDFWLDISAQKLGDGFVVTFTDVSATKRAAVLIEKSAAELRTVIDSAQVAIFLINPVFNELGRIVDFRFRTANQMIASYVGQEPEALTGELVSRWFPDYLTNGLFMRYVAIFETGRTQHFNLHYGTETIDAWESYTVLKQGNDVLVTFSDYTELKKLQQRLEISATELQTVIDTCQTGIFLFTPIRDLAGEVTDFRFRLANRQLASYVGEDSETLIGALGSTYFPDYKTNGLFERYYHTYSTGETQRFDFHYFGSGIDVWLDIMTTKLNDDVLVTFGDYTPLKRLQQELENSVVELQRSNKNLEQFAYVASHDLQEPLRKIQAFGDIIRSQFAPVIGTEGADMISRMQSAAARMQVLIKDVLAYSRIVTKQETVGPVNLDQVVADVLTDLETAIAEKEASITVGPLPVIRGDAAQLRQLFQNLFSNALKFTRLDDADNLPAVRISSRQLYGRELTAPSLLPSDANRLFHLIEVTDNGIGFDQHQAERIFQVFQRLHGRSEYQGTGIGLAIVQKVIDNHQGHIFAEGRPGQGAVFRILLPV